MDTSGMGAVARSIHPEPVPGTRGPLAVGLDIGGTTTVAVLIDSQAKLVESVTLPTRPGSGGVVDGAVKAIERLCAAGQLSKSCISRIGVGVPGIVDTRKGTICHAVNLRIGESPLHLADMLVRRFGVAAAIDNDLNVAALGAAQTMAQAMGQDMAVQGVPAGHVQSGTTQREDLAFLALGTGIAAGLYLDGKIHRGQGSAGEIGHIPWDPHGPLCPCGQYGCLELYASGSALTAAWPNSGGTPAPVAIYQAAAAGNAEAIAVKARHARAVAAAVRLLALSVDPRHIVLGGGVSQLGQPLLDAVTAALDDYCGQSTFLTSLQLSSRLQLAPRDIPVAAIGAAVLAQDTPQVVGACAR